MKLAVASHAFPQTAGVLSSGWMKSGIRGLITACALAAFAQRDAVALSSADEIPNYSLLDYRGRYHELHRLESKVAVLF